ncbi:MAG: 4'-phosphopantetheinyl transferase superfamily protein [Saprospiraceae bacterium]|nr:4'-phosphopantetheinyl transferase superfamily protein [Saprospiraceae bacterium]
MPAIHIESKISELSLFLWEITEDIDWFRKDAMLTEMENNEFDAMTGKRRLEYMVQRFLLRKNLEGNRPIMLKTRNGKPYLINRPEQISISHSKNLLILSVGTKNHGVDLEKIDPRINRLASKFCNEEEMRVPDYTQADFWYTLIWSCKESLYKVDGLGQLEFRSQLAVHFTPESFDRKWGRGLVRRNNKEVYFRLYFEEIDGFVVTWAWPTFNI